MESVNGKGGKRFEKFKQNQLHLRGLSGGMKDGDCPLLSSSQSCFFKYKSGIHPGRDAVSSQGITHTLSHTPKRILTNPEQ